MMKGSFFLNNVASRFHYNRWREPGTPLGNVHVQSSATRQAEDIMEIVNNIEVIISNLGIAKENLGHVNITTNATNGSLRGYPKDEDEVFPLLWKLL
jgi:hypothetical protein